MKAPHPKGQFPHRGYSGQGVENVAVDKSVQDVKVGRTFIKPLLVPFCDDYTDTIGIRKRSKSEARNMTLSRTSGLPRKSSRAFATS
jgi:hypothetical protein